MIVSFSGHRPDKLGGFYVPNPTYVKICQKIDTALDELKPDKIISGMALGVDQWAAYIAFKKKIPFIAAIPFEGQENAWPFKSQYIYRILLKMAAEKVIVSEGGYSSYKMQKRNEWMVDRCDRLIAVYNGDKSSGTYNCIEYAKSINKEIFYIDPGLDRE